MGNGERGEYAGGLDYVNYELDPQKIQEITNGFIAAMLELEEAPDKINAGATQGVIVIGGEDPRSNLGRHIEASVFSETFGNTPEELKEEYGPYEAHSTFIIAVDIGKRAPQAVMRLIRNSEAGLKSLNDLKIGTSEGDEKSWNLSPEIVQDMYDLELDDVWDIATIAAVPECRRGSMATGYLFRSLYLETQAKGFSHWVAMMDTKPLRLIKRMGFPYEITGDVDPIEYLGSKSTVPIIFAMDGFEEKHKAANPASHSMFVKGFGIDDSSIVYSL